MIFPALSAVKFGLPIRYYDLIVEAILPLEYIQEILIVGNRCSKKAEVRVIHASDIQLLIVGENITDRDCQVLRDKLNSLSIPFNLDIQAYQSFVKPSAKAKIDQQGKIFFKRVNP